MKRWLVGFGIAFAVLVLLSCAGIPLLDFLLVHLIVYVGMLLVGWVWFLQRTLPFIRLDGAAILLGVASLGLLAAMLHGVLRTWQTTIATDDAEPSRRWRRRGTLAVVGGGLGASVAGICLVGIVHEMLWMARADEPMARWELGARQAARRAQSRNNLMQLGLALYNYHDTFSALPAGGSFGPHGEAEHGWLTYLLPFADQAALYKQIDLRRPWRDPVNRPHLSTRIPSFLVPGLPEKEEFTSEGYVVSCYAANELVMGGGPPLRFSDITDGTSTTLLAGEARSNLKPWGHPTNWRDARLGINQSDDGFGGPWTTHGANFLMADGSVRFINEQIDPKILRALATPSGGDKVSAF